MYACVPARSHVVNYDFVRRKIFLCFCKESFSGLLKVSVIKTLVFHFELFLSFFLLYFFDTTLHFLAKII